MKHSTKGMRRKWAKREAQLRLLRGQLVVVALDLHKWWAHAVAMNREGFVLARRRFVRSEGGLSELLRWARKIQRKVGADRLLWSMEPTSHFWKLTVAHLEAQGMSAVLVQPLVVRRAREMEDYTPTKSDFRDAELIGRLTLEGRFYPARLPERLWATLRHLALERLRRVDQRSSERNLMRSLLELVFPAFFEAISKVEGKAAQAILRVCPDPEQIAQMSLDEFTEAVKAAYDGPYPKRQVIKRVWKAAHEPGGVASERPGACPRIQRAAQMHACLSTDIAELEEELIEQLAETGYLEILTSIPGLGLVSAATILGLTGDPRLYDTPRAVAKLAGICARENESGEYQGRTPVTKRGRPDLRCVAYRAAMSMIRNNAEFAARHAYLRTRSKDPLHYIQALLAVAAKLLRTIQAMCRSGELYSPAVARGEVMPTAA